MDPDELSDAEIDRDLGIKPLRKTSVVRLEALLKRRKAARRFSWGPWLRLMAVVLKVLAFPLVEPFHRSRRRGAHGEVVEKKQAIGWRIANAVVGRLLVAPIILAGFFVTLVYLTTHPARLHASQTPQVYGMYYRDVAIAADDGCTLRGWYLPAVGARSILYHGAKALVARHPAALLCHGSGETNDFYLHLADKLHRAGFTVLLLNLRGQGGSGGAQAFGLLERRDIIAGVGYLSRRKAVHADHIFVVGRKGAANAALIAASRDPAIAGVVADGPFFIHQRLTRIFAAAGLAQRPFAAMYALAFSVMEQQDISQFNLRAIVRKLHQPVLFIARTSRVQGLGDVLNLAGCKVRGGRFIGPDGLYSPRGDLNTQIADFLKKLAYAKVAPKPMPSYKS